MDDTSPSASASASASASTSAESCSTTYDLIVIGGGVVGLACLRAATLKGWKCALVEAESDLLLHASGGNSGIVCTGVDAAAGSLERALIRDSISEFRPYCAEHNIPLRPCGSLVCLFPWDIIGGSESDASDTSNAISTSNASDDTSSSKVSLDHNNNHHNPVALLDHVLEESHMAGDCDAKLYTRANGHETEILQEKERNISSSLLGAVHIPGEMVVDSWVYSISLAADALENGADIYTNFKVNRISSLRSDENNNSNNNEILWNVGRTSSDDTASSHDIASSEHPIPIPLMLRGKAVVNATGNWSETIEKSALGTAPWVSKPRRGQYRVYKANPQTQILHPLQPVPTQRTKGIFVFSSIHNHLVVGPTALDQSSRTDRSIDPEVSRQLDEHIRRVLPQIDTESSHVGDYVGIRPGTDHRDYQIHLNPQKRWIAVAGIRSTGLTASLGIGNYVTRLLSVVLEDPPPSKRSKSRTVQMPTFEELAQDYIAHGDGCCEIYGETFRRRFKVSHPLTKFGLESFVGKSTSTTE